MAYEPDRIPTTPDATVDERQDAMSSWWQHARDLAAWIRGGNTPPAIDVWGPLLGPEEDGRMVAQMEYSRLYGTNANYRHNNLFVLGPTEFVLGAWGVNALLNESRRSAAQKRAATQWRDHQTTSVTVTSKRLFCRVASGKQLDFYYSYINEFVPDLANWSVTLGFTGDASPLRLTGPAAPELAVLIAHALYGDRSMSHPELHQLQ